MLLEAMMWGCSRVHELVEGRVPWNILYRLPVFLGEFRRCSTLHVIPGGLSPQVSMIVVTQQLHLTSTHLERVL